MSMAGMTRNGSAVARKSRNLAKAWRNISGSNSKVGERHLGEYAASPRKNRNDSNIEALRRKIAANGIMREKMLEPSKKAKNEGEEAGEASCGERMA